MVLLCNALIQDKRNKLRKKKSEEMRKSLTGTLPEEVMVTSFREAAMAAARSASFSSEAGLD